MPLTINAPFGVGSGTNRAIMARKRLKCQRENRIAPKNSLKWRDTLLPKLISEEVRVKM